MNFDKESDIHMSHEAWCLLRADLIFIMSKSQRLTLNEPLQSFTPRIFASKKDDNYLQISIFLFLFSFLSDTHERTIFIQVKKPKTQQTGYETETNVPTKIPQFPNTS